jgi:hypothetical protein
VAVGLRALSGTGGGNEECRWSDSTDGQSGEQVVVGCDTEELLRCAHLFNTDSFFLDVV